MPKPMICLFDALRKYLELFRPCFSRRQWKYFVTVLLGLIEHEGRHTLKGLLSSVWEKVSLSGLSRFLGLWPWSPEELAQTWQAGDGRGSAGRTSSPAGGATQAARTSQGNPRDRLPGPRRFGPQQAQRAEDGRPGPPLLDHGEIPGRCLFTSLYLLLDRRCPLLPRLYRQKAVCEREGVPFQSKVDLAAAEIATFQPPPNTHPHVLVDSWYHCRRVRRAAARRGWDLSGGLKSNRWMRISTPEKGLEWVLLSTYAASLEAADWVEAAWPAQEGGRKVYVHAVRTWVRKLGPTLVLITRYSLDQPLAQARYWGSTLVDAAAQTVIDILATRWDIETLFEDYKDLLGSDHYQVMSAAAIVRFWTLVSCLACFLDKQRARLQTGRPGEHITWGDARHAIQTEHQRNLLVWLEDQFRSGITAGQLWARLAA